MATSYGYLFLPFLLLGPVASLIFDEASQNIHQYVDGLPKVSGNSLCQKYKCCNITANEKCDISAMPSDQSTLVLPGGETRCIFGDSVCVLG
jgi:hypothetical protein